MTRKRFTVSLDTMLPGERDFLLMAEKLSPSRRQEWVRMIIRSGFTLYKDNMAKPGFDGFHSAPDNLGAAGGKSAGKLSDEVEDRIDTPSAVVAPLAAPNLNAEHPLRGMFKTHTAHQS